jgi:hypothetical protein
MKPTSKQPYNYSHSNHERKVRKNQIFGSLGSIKIEEKPVKKQKEMIENRNLPPESVILVSVQAPQDGQK